MLCVFYQVIRTNNHTSDTTSQDSQTEEHIIPALKKFKFLASKLAQNAISQPVRTSVGEQLTQYLSEVQHSASSTPALAYWEQKAASLPLLAPFAQDVLSAPASQAYVERIFSLCGLLCSGRRSRMHKSLQMRACLKLNDTVLRETDFTT